MHKEGCKLKWKKPKDDGGEPIECYSVEKFDADSGMWLPVGKTKDPELDVLGLVPGHEYHFRVKAVNKEGESEPLETMAPIIAKDPFCKWLYTLHNVGNVVVKFFLCCRSRSQCSTQSRGDRLEPQLRGTFMEGTEFRRRCSHHRLHNREA